MTKKGWLIFIAIVALALGGAIYLSRQNKVVLPEGTDHNKVQLPSEYNGQIGDHTYGNKDSKLVLIEYGDYQCPGCASAAPVVKQVVDKYKDKVLFVFRSRLMPYHANARAAASFAEAAGLQGKYWEMHNKLYETQQTWENLSGQQRTDYFATLVQQAGGDPDKARSDIENETIAKKITYDAALADARAVSGTPSLYLNGEKVEAFMDGKIVSSNTQGATQLWADAELLEKHVIIPALEKAGIEY